MKNNFRTIQFILISILFIGCEKDHLTATPDNNNYLVKYKTDLSIANSQTKVEYDYDALGRLIKMGDTTNLYLYSDTLIKEIFYNFKGGSGTYTYHSLNPEKLVKKSILYSLDAEPTIDNIFLYYTYKYDSQGHLTEQSVYDGNNTLTNTNTYIWEGDNIIEEIFGIVTANSTIYTVTTVKYDYYMDKLNNFSFGFDFFGKRTHNLIKQRTAAGSYWEKYYYEFDSKERPVKETKASMQYFSYNSHYGTHFLDSIPSTRITGYEY